MKVRLKNGLMVVTAESPEEGQAIAEWAGAAEGHVFAIKLQGAATVCFSDLGPRAEVCREPINVSSRSADPQIRLISNFAHTPFELDGLTYASVEAFWQGLKYSDEARRREIAALHGLEARQAGAAAGEPATIEYLGETVRVGTCDHWQLMLRACRAKFSQDEAARDALLGTGERPLKHKTRQDSRTIPAVVMVDIWMRVRRELVESQQ